MKHALTFLFILLLAASLTYVATSSAELPEKIATHFNAQNAADGWMARSSYRLYALAITALVPSILALTFWSFRFCSAETLSVPHKAIWTSPLLRPRLNSLMTKTGLALGCVSVAYFTAIHALVIRANSLPTPRLEGSLTALTTGVSVLLHIIVALLFVLRLLRPPKPAQGED